MQIIYEGAGGTVICVGVSEKLRLTDEIAEDFATRMIAEIVPGGARHLVNPSIPTDTPPERWAVDWDTGQITATDVPLADVKAEYRKRVDDDAERERLKYITPGDGMAMTYQEKFANAEAVDDLGETAANALTEQEYTAQFPVLSASVGVEAATLWECAQLVIARYEAFATIGRGIEGARLQGKKAISEAADQAAVIAAYEAITWPTLQT